MLVWRQCTEPLKTKFPITSGALQKNLAAHQKDIGNVKDGKHWYKLRLNNAIPIKVKLIKLWL